MSSETTTDASPGEALPLIRVAAAVLQREGRLLVARRVAPDWLAGKWEFPGGKIEADESATECLVRELHEEFAITVSVGSHLITTEHAYPALRVELQAFHASWVRGEPVPVDHDRILWAQPEELSSLDWAEADLPILAALQRQAGVPEG